MGTKLNLLGYKFYSLTIIEQLHNRKRNNVIWRAQCDCGNLLDISSTQIRNEHIRSCGCVGDLTGRVFGKLTILNKELGDFQYKETYFNKKTGAFSTIYRLTWKCQCVCMNILYLSHKHLLCRKHMSCNNCANLKNSHQDLIGQKFGKLTVVASELGENKKKTFTWKCLCECGKINYVATNTLKSGHTKSCGCGEIENRIKAVALGRAIRTANRQNPRISAAQWIFNGIYSDGDLTFEEFLHMSQQNCFYCNIEPSNNFKFSSRKWTQEYRDASLFIYNGLDRKDSNGKHSKDNVVTCCMHCNFAKRAVPFDFFIAQIAKVHTSTMQGRNEVILPSDEEFWIYAKEHELYNENKLARQYNGLALTLAGRKLKDRFYGRVAKSAKQGYNNGDLTLNQFLYLITQVCWYCGEQASNRVKFFDINNQPQYYPINGLDRLDNDLPHNLNNVVPSCKYCNYSKRKYTVKEFLDWNDLVYNNLKTKGLLV